MLVVFAFASPQMHPRVRPEWNQAIHLVAYAVFGVLCLRAFHGGFTAFLRTRQTLLAVILALGYAFLDEWNQTRIVGREASVADWLVDAAGVGLAVLVAGAMIRFGPRMAGDAVGGTSEGSDGGER